MSFETVGSIVNDAALELGLITSEKADVFAETDPNVVQLLALLKRLGRKLSRQYTWAQLRDTHTITTVALTATYALPTGFVRIVDGTVWNRTQDRQMIPTSPQAWHYLQANGPTGIDSDFAFRILDNKFELFDTAPTASETIAFEYLHDLWVGTTATLPGTLDEPTAHDYYVFFDPEVMISGLVHGFKKANGFDTTECYQDYREAIGSALNSSEAGGPLTLSGGGAAERMVDGRNLPDTGFGS